MSCSVANTGALTDSSAMCSKVDVSISMYERGLRRLIKLILYWTKLPIGFEAWDKAVLSHISPASNPGVHLTVGK